MGRAARAWAVWRGAGLTGQMLRGGVAVGGIMVAGSVCALLAAILLARAMGPGDLGLYAVALSILTLVTLPIESGLPALVGREVARAQAVGDWGGMASILRFADRAALGMGAVILGGMAGLLLATGRDGAVAQALLVGVVYVPVAVIGGLRAATLVGLNRVAAGTLPVEVVRPLGLALAVLAWGVWGPGPLTPAVAVGLQLPGCLAAWALAEWELARHRPADLRGARIRMQARLWVRMTWRLGLTRGLRVGDGHIMTVMVGTLGSPAAAGFLRIALRGAEMAALGHRTIVQLLAPQIARLDALGDRTRLQKLLTRSAQVMTGLQLLALGLFTFAGGWIIEVLFGAAFRPAWGALVLLTSVHLVRAVFGSTAILMNSLRREAIFSRSLVLKIGMGVLIGSALIRTWGEEGAALALLVGTTVQSVYLWQAARRLGLRPTAIGL